MKLDPSEEDSDDSGNGGRDSPVGEAGQMTDLEVCYFYQSTRRRRNLKTQQSPAILDLCLRKTRAGKSHNYRAVIVFEKLRFQNVFRLH